MEMLLPALGNVAPPVAVAMLLGWLVLRLWRQASADRESYQRAVDGLREDYAAQLHRQTERHDAQIAELRQQQHAMIADLRGEVTALRRDLAQVRSDLDQERRSRHAAEDEAARYRRQLGLVDGSTS